MRRCGSAKSIDAASIDTSVLIVGGGPVGAHAGHGPCLARHRRRSSPRSGTPANRRTSNAIRCRPARWKSSAGSASPTKIRDAGLPPDYPQRRALPHLGDRRSSSRITLPSRAGRVAASSGDDSWWPTPESPHRINQICLSSRSCSRMRRAAAHPHPQSHEFEEFTQDEQRRDRRRPRPRQRRAHLSLLPLSGRLRRWPLDGAPAASAPSLPASRSCSACNRPISARRSSRAAARQAGLDVSRLQSAPLRHHDGDRRPGALADPQFSLHGETEFDSVDRDWAIRNILGVGADFDYEVISKEDWIGRRLVADRFRERPGVHLRRRRASVDSARRLRHECRHRRRRRSGVDAGGGAERLGRAARCSTPIRRNASRSPTRCRSSPSTCRRQFEAAPRNPGGDRARRTCRRRDPRAIGREAYDLYVQQQCCGGLNFGYFYDGSPVDRL